MESSVISAGAAVFSLIISLLTLLTPDESLVFSYNLYANRENIQIKSKIILFVVYIV